MARILVVDDEVYIRKIVEYNLKKAGYEVKVAEDAFEAQEIIESDGRFDLIISDLMMPIMSGMELVRNIRDKYKLEDQKILFLSAKAMEDDVKEARKYRVDDYIMKPFNVERLLKKIDKIINNKE